MSLNDDTFTRRHTFTLEECCNVLAGKQSAALDERRKTYINATIGDDSHREVKAELQAARELSDISVHMKDSITLGELQYAITNLNVK